MNCEFFEVVDWDEEANCPNHAVCTKLSPEWPNCLKCQSRAEYNNLNNEEE